MYSGGVDAALVSGLGHILQEVGQDKRSDSLSTLSAKLIHQGDLRQAGENPL